MSLAPEHAAWLEGHAVNLEFAERLGVRSIASAADLPEAINTPMFVRNLPGLLLPWTSPDGRINWQLHPDTAPVNDAGKTIKYLFQPRQAPVLWAVRHNPKATKILICEGSKQCLCAAFYAPPEFAVYGVAGCWGWRHKEGGKDSTSSTPIIDLAIAEGKEVFVLFDADAGKNLDVYNAGIELAEALIPEGAAKIQWVRLPASGTTGLDDVLAKRTPEQRAPYLAGLISNAKDKVAPRKPTVTRQQRATDGAAYFNDNGLMAKKLAEDALDLAPAALTAEHTIAMYDSGVYAADGSRFSGAVVMLLGNDFRPNHRSTAEEVAIALLRDQGRVLPDRMGQQLLNLRNGVLDLRTSTLSEHTPDLLSSVQLPITWDEGAQCPVYEEWLAEVIPDQIDDLEEVASTMLDPTRTPPKALFAFGPSRSGKSTFLRLLGALAGPRYRSAVSLQQLATDRFAAANIYGKILNSAADLSSAHVEDLSLFKMLTGEDLIQANRKYGHQFVFTNRALFAFSANEVPTVGDSSRAYAERIKPFTFGYSFAGRENPAIEDKMHTELSGILVRLVRAWQRLTARGAYLPTVPRVAEAFEASSDRVRLWVIERCRLVPATPGSLVDAQDMTTKRDLGQAFNLWALEQHASPMGERKILERLTSIEGVVEVRDRAHRARGLNIVVGKLIDGGDDDAWQEWHNRPTPSPSPISTRDLVEDRSKGGGVNSERGRPVVPLLPQTAIVFDLETASATELYSRGDDFVRLAGFQGLEDDEVTVTTDWPALVARLQDAELVIGHNIMGFDCPALAQRHGLRIQPLAASGRLFDTLLAARYLDPPQAKQHGRDFSRRYDLDSLAKRYIGPDAAKSTSLAALATKYKNYDAIPTDPQDPDEERAKDATVYREYLEQDVTLTAQLYRALAKEVAAHPTAPAYLKREHRVAAIATQISINGFRVDREVLDGRLARNEEIRVESLVRLRDEFGIPLTGKGKEGGEMVKSPLATRAAKDALIDAFAEQGVTSFWVTGKSNDIATSREAMQQLALQNMDKPKVREICRLVAAVVSLRSVYMTVQRNLVGEDRVHCTVSMKQSTGRWSLSRPGLTVMGKRGGRWREREMFIADPGDVIIAVDLSQVDMRAIAGLSGDDAYISMLRHEDPHGEIAKLLFGDPGMREIAKPIGHGWNYGRGLKAISDSNDIAPALVRQFDNEMRERFPRLVEWREEVRASAKEGDLLNNGWGRFMRPEPSRSHTQGPALMGQGCARDIMMHGLLRLPEECLPMLRAQVHDEVILSVPAADAVEIQDVVIGALSFDWAAPSDKIVPIVAEGGPTDRTSWGGVYRK